MASSPWKQRIEDADHTLFAQYVGTYDLLKSWEFLDIVFYEKQFDE